MTTVLLQQLILTFAAGSIAGAAIAALRRGRLSFGIAVMWSSIGALGLFAAAIIPAVDRVGLFLGVLPAALLAAGASTVLALIAFTLSLRVSSLESALQETVEAFALASASGLASPVTPYATIAIVPAYNEGRSVGEVVDFLKNLELPVIVINDGSTDDTASIARQHGATVVSLPTNLGVGGALRAGVRLALLSGYGQVIQCDADGQHPADAVRSLVAAQDADPHDMLIGSRFTAHGTGYGQGPVRKTAMTLLAFLSSRAAGTRITDATSGLRIIRRPLLDQVAKHLPRHYLGDTFELLLSAGRAGYQIGEIPVKMMPRSYGHSSASFGTALVLTFRALFVALLRGHPRLQLSGRAATSRRVPRSARR